jgi:hypothetical protein
MKTGGKPKLNLFIYFIFLSIENTDDKRANMLSPISYSLINSDGKEKGALFVTTFQILD